MVVVDGIEEAVEVSAVICVCVYVSDEGDAELARIQ